jgi:hypothetical protein
VNTNNFTSAIDHAVSAAASTFVPKWKKPISFASRPAFDLWGSFRLPDSAASSFRLPLRVGRIVRFPARFVKICPNAGPAGLYRELSVSWILLANSPTKNLCISPNLIYRAYASETESSRPGEFHPQSLTEPDLTLSRRPARRRFTLFRPRLGIRRFDEDLHHDAIERVKPLIDGPDSDRTAEFEALILARVVGGPIGNAR